MPAASEELTRARKDEIVNACAQLYETMSFKDITLRDIGARTSFTRTSIYNYFQTKEEICLALMQREYEAWAGDLEAILRTHEVLSAEGFADQLARTLARRSRLLKLMAMNLYDMEANSRLENLVDLKRAYGASLQAVRRCLEHYFPAMTQADVQAFLYAFFPFLFGVYPYSEATEKQKQAMETVGIDYPNYSIYELVKPLAARLLASAGGKEGRPYEDRGPGGQP